MTLLPNQEPFTWSVDTFKVVLVNATNILVGLASTVAVVFIVIGAFQYLTAFGSEEKAESGKKTLLWAILGLTLIIMARVLLGAVWHFFTGGTPPADITG